MMKVVVGAGSCGIAAGADKVYEGLSIFLAEKDLSVELEKTGCIGTCFLEPIVEVHYDRHIKRFTNVESFIRKNYAKN